MNKITLFISIFLLVSSGLQAQSLEAADISINENLKKLFIQADKIVAASPERNAAREADFKALKASVISESFYTRAFMIATFYNAVEPERIADADEQYIRDAYAYFSAVMDLVSRNSDKNGNKIPAEQFRGFYEAYRAHYTEERSIARTLSTVMDKIIEREKAEDEANPQR